MMQVVRSFKVSLSFDDISENVNECSKQKLIRIFKMLLDRKEMQINDKIQKLNAQHLLILQKKVLVLEKKDDQIVKLNTAISALKNELHEEQMRYSQLTDEFIDIKLKKMSFEKRVQQIQSINKDYREKKQKQKLEIENLKQKLKSLEDYNEVEQRQLKKIKDQKQLWHEETDLLLRNIKNEIESQHQKKIQYMELDFSNKISILKAKYEGTKKKYEESKKTVAQVTKTIQFLQRQKQEEKKKVLKKIIKRQNIQIQTEEFDIEMSPLNSPHGQIIQKEDEFIQVNLECQTCRRLQKEVKNAINEDSKRLTSKIKKQGQTVDQQTQTQRQKQKRPIILSNTSMQTVQKFLPIEEERQLFQNIKNVAQTSAEIIRNMNAKYFQLQQLYLNRPSRRQDIDFSHRLQAQIAKLKLNILEKEQQIQKLKVAMRELKRDETNIQSKLWFKTNVQDYERKTVSRGQKFERRKKYTSRSSTNNEFYKSKLNSSENDRIKSHTFHLRMQRYDEQGEERENRLKEILLDKGIIFEEKLSGIEEHKKSPIYRKFKTFSNKRVRSCGKTTL